MALSGMTKSALIMAGFFSATTFVVVYSMCGIVSNIFIGVVYGLFEFAAGCYYTYLTYITKTDKKMRVLYAGVAAASIISAITNWSMHAKLFTEYDIASRWFIVFFISLGLFCNASVPFTYVTDKYMRDILEANQFDEFKEQVMYLILNTIIVIIQSIVMSVFSQKTENEMVKILSARSVATVACGAFIGFAFGTYLGSRDVQDIGFIQPDEE